MFDAKLISRYVESLGYAVSDEIIADLVDGAAKLVDSTPSEILKFIFDVSLEIRGQVCFAPLRDTPSNVNVFLTYTGSGWKYVERNDNDIVLYNCKDDSSEILDVDDASSLVALWFDPLDQKIDENNTSESHLSTKRLLSSALKENPRWIFDVALATIMVNVFAVVTSLFAMQVYDRVVPTLALNTLYSLVAGVCLIYFFDFLLKVGRSRVLDVNSSFIDKSISRKVFDHLLQSKINKLPSKLGTLTSQISGIDSARQFFSSTIIFAIVDLPFSILFIFMIYIVGGNIAFVYASFFIVAICIGFLAQKYSHKANMEYTQKSNEKMGVLVDAIRGGETIRSTNSQSLFLKRWNDIVDSVSTSGLIQKKISNFATSFSQSMGSFSYVVAIVIGVHGVGEGNLTMGSMIACSILGGRVLGPVGQAVGYLIQYEGVRQSIDLVDEFLKVPRARALGSAKIFPAIPPSHVEFESVTFAYEGASVPQIDINSLQLKRGERIAVLGGIGSGKSTFLKVLAGIMPPSAGRIRLDGVDVWDLDQHYIAKNVSYLPQSPDLFKGTLKENLLMGTLSSDSKLLRVVRSLNLESIYATNDKGIEMEIAEGGSGLSGGQRQMVGLARILANSPRIWILDEPTASLDPQTQNLVLNALKNELSKDDILIFATHNVKLAMDLADRILVFDKGVISKDVPAKNVEVRSAAA